VIIRSPIIEKRTVNGLSFGVTSYLLGTLFGYRLLNSININFITENCKDFFIEITFFIMMTASENRNQQKFVRILGPGWVTLLKITIGNKTKLGIVVL